MIKQITNCAACGGPINIPVGLRGRSRDFCSSECIQLGRAHCKACGKDLPQRSRYAAKDFCDRLCRGRYYHIGTEINPALLKEWKRSTCKACGKDIIQPKTNRRQFCDNSNYCANKYRLTQKYGQNILEAWGMYGPETRKALREVEQMLGPRMGPGMAKQLALAIDREYILRKPDQKNIRGAYETHICKTCGEEFYRRPWSLRSREYCKPAHEPARMQAAAERKSLGKRLSWEIVDEIRSLCTSGQLSITAIAEKYGITMGSVWLIATYRTWKPEHDPRSEKYQRKELILTQEQAAEIRDLYESNHLSQRKLAAKYGVTKTTIANIIHYRHGWRPENNPSRQNVYVN